MTTLLAINNYYYRRGGAEVVYLEQNRMFEALGWQVIPFAMKHLNNLDTPWSSYFVEQIEFGEPYSWRERLVRVPKVIYSLEARRQLARLLDRVRVNVCHAHNVYHHISPSIFSLLHERGIPTVLTLHDLKIACPAYHMLAPDGICERCKGGRLHNVVLHRCIKGSTGLSTVVMIEAILHRLLGTYRRYVSRFVVPSRFYVDKLCEWGVSASLLTHVPNFVDARAYRPEYTAGRGVIYFGRVSREKGLATLIRAAAAVRCTVRIAGAGPELESLRALAAQLGADVTFLGYLKGEALHTAIREARAVVLPSEWYENAPVSVLEAYALGKPLVGARIGGIPELIRETETGVGFQSGDAKSLGDALHRMMNCSDVEIERMGRGARSWVEQDFTTAVYRDRILSIYRELGIDGFAVHRDLPATATGSELP
jgi:glycosyltransferase involved in cell wall biosynthesis